MSSVKPSTADPTESPGMSNGLGRPALTQILFRGPNRPKSMFANLMPSVTPST